MGFVGRSSLQRALTCRSTTCMSSARECASFWITRVADSASTRCSLSLSSLAVATTTGRWKCRGFSLSRRRNSKPSISGIIKSSTINPGFFGLHGEQPFVAIGCRRHLIAGAEQGTLHDLPHRRIVVHDQDREAVACGGQPAPHGLDQVQGMDGFDQVVRRAQRHTEIGALQRGDHHHGNRRGLGVFLEPCQHRPAISGRHVDVQYDHPRLLQPCRLQTRVSRARPLHAKAALRQRVAEHRIRRLVIIDHEHQ